MHKDALYWIIFLNVLASFYNLGVIWAMQIFIYPRVGSAAVTKIFTLPSLVTLFCAFALIFRHGPLMPLWFLLVGLIIQISAILYSAYIWAPIAFTLKIKDKRVNWHWIKVAFITIYNLLAICEMSLFIVGKTL